MANEPTRQNGAGGSNAAPTPNAAPKRKRRKVNATGRNERGEQYANFSYDFLQSPAFRHLSGNAVKVYMELRSRFNGGNNGRIPFGQEAAAETLHIGKTSVRRALDELQAHGFIALQKRGQWYGRMASEWRLTDKAADGYAPTYDWKNWQPPKTEGGAKADHIGSGYGPYQHRDAESWSGTVPVKAA